MAVYVSRKRKVEDSVDSDIDKKQGSWLILIVTEKCRSRAFHSWSDLSVSDFFSDVNWYNSHRFNKHVLKNQKISLSLSPSLWDGVWVRSWEPMVLFQLFVSLKKTVFFLCSVWCFFDVWVFTLSLVVVRAVLCVCVIVCLRQHALCGTEFTKLTHRHAIKLFPPVQFSVEEAVIRPVLLRLWGAIRPWMSPLPRLLCGALLWS